jgi:hypothetical protein
MSDLFNEKAKDWDASERKQLISSAVGAAILKKRAFKPTNECYGFRCRNGID